MQGVELTFAFSLDIGGFDNVDLFRRGYYLLYFNIKPPAPQGTVNLSCSVKRNKHSGTDGLCRVINNGCTAVSAPVLVQFAKQSCDVNSHFSGTISMVVPTRLVCTAKGCLPPIEASIDLYFAPLRRDRDTTSVAIPDIAGYDKIDSRPLQLSVCSSSNQLHSARYILFRYRNHSGITLQMHLALCAAKPVVVDKLKDKTSILGWLSISSTPSLEIPATAIVSAPEAHANISLGLLRHLCTILLESQVSLVDKCQEFTRSTSLNVERQCVTLRVDELVRGCESLVPIHQAMDHLATASAVALSMWDVFVLVLAQEEDIGERLRYEFHEQQVNRFRHLHFLIKLPIAELLLSPPGESRLTYTSACEAVSGLTKSGYCSVVFAERLPVLCPETDCMEFNAPVIMEQRFARLKSSSQHVSAHRFTSGAALHNSVLAKGKGRSLPLTIDSAAAKRSPPLQVRSTSVALPSAAERVGGDLECHVLHAPYLPPSPTSTVALSTAGNMIDNWFNRRGHPQGSARATVHSVRRSIGSARERLRPFLPKRWMFLSEVSKMTVSAPYFTRANAPSPITDVHLVVCVHGLEGHSDDLSALRNFLQVALPDQPLVFLMAHCIEDRTFASFQSMGKWLAEEVLSFIMSSDITCSHMSFVGHSLGNIAIRSALSMPAMQGYLDILHTYLSLAGPHLGTVYAGSLVGTGMWLIQKYTKSVSLLELSMRDNSDPRKTILYELSLKPGLALFRHVLLVSCHQDQYVPFHSARIEVSPLAGNDDMGGAQQEMVHNILFPLLADTCQTELRVFNVVHQFQNTDVDVLVGRAGHVALLDSELCLEMMVQTSLFRFFQTGSKPSEELSHSLAAASAGQQQ